MPKLLGVRETITIVREERSDYFGHELLRLTDELRTRYLTIMLWELFAVPGADDVKPSDKVEIHGTKIYPAFPLMRVYAAPLQIAPIPFLIAGAEPVTHLTAPLGTTVYATFLVSRDVC